MSNDIREAVRERYGRIATLAAGIVTADEVAAAADAVVSAKITAIKP